MAVLSHRYSDPSCMCRHCAQPIIDLINMRFEALELQPLTEEQIECLCDHERAEESWGMLDHFEANDWIVGSERGEVAAFISRAEMESPV